MLLIITSGSHRSAPCYPSSANRALLVGIILQSDCIRFTGSPSEQARIFPGDRVQLLFLSSLESLLASSRSCSTYVNQYKCIAVHCVLC